jgi:hypothetical protein
MAAAVSATATPETGARPCVKVCDTCAEAEDLILRLQQAGCDMAALSIAGRCPAPEGQVTGCYQTGDRMKFWGLLGPFWGGVWSIFAGSAFFLLPGLGGVVVGGPLAAAIAGALERASGIGGLSVLGVGLCALGVSKNEAADCELALREDRFLVIARNPSAAAPAVREILAAGTDFGGHSAIR